MANNPKERQQWILDELKVSPMESLETEIWKEVENYPDYDIRSYGRVKSYKRSNGRLMSLSSDGQGYLKVNFDIGGKNKSIKVHRLVASAFLKEVKGKNYVNHKDGNKKNNHISNLEWVTPSENTRHAFDNGLNVARKCEDHPLAKLRKDDVLEIRQLAKCNVPVKSIASRFDISDNHTRQIIKEEAWKM